MSKVMSWALFPFKFERRLRTHTADTPTKGDLPMSKVMSWALFPFKFGSRLLYAGLLVAIGAVALGDFATPIRAVATSLVSLFGPGLGDTMFDPSVSDDSVRELELIDDTEEDVRPKLIRSTTLIRKQRAEIEYLRELSGFLEERIPDEEMAMLHSMEEQGACGEIERSALSPNARTWLGYHERVWSLESSLESLLHLDQRVTTLYDRLKSRRSEVLGLMPEAEAVVQVEKPRPLTAVDEVGVLLDEAHEELFKLLYALDPGLVE